MSVMVKLTSKVPSVANTRLIVLPAAGTTCGPTIQSYVEILASMLLIAFSKKGSSLQTGFLLIEKSAVCSGIMTTGLVIVSAQVPFVTISLTLYVPGPG